MKLQKAIESYVLLKRAMGATFKNTEKLLASFRRAAGEDMDVGSVSPDRVFAFVTGVSGYSRAKYNALGGFYRYATSRGYATRSPLPPTLPKATKQFVPYIYSRDEIGRLLAATSTYQKGHCTLQPHTFRAILLLLYGAGLRVSEALSLTLADVNLCDGVITIRYTKFQKTRLVPLGSDLRRAMTSYSILREKCGHLQNSDARFFVERSRPEVPYNTIYSAFRRLRAHAGVVRTDGSPYQPRLHDLRHAFAVHRLISWYRDGADVQRLLPQLSTYMGHVDISSTQWYLTMTADLLREASMRFERYAFQEVRHD